MRLPKLSHSLCFFAGGGFTSPWPEQPVLTKVCDDCLPTAGHHQRGGPRGGSSTQWMWGFRCDMRTVWCLWKPPRLSMGTVRVTIRYLELLKVGVFCYRLLHWAISSAYKTVSGRYVSLHYHSQSFFKGTECGLTVFELLDTNIVFQIILPHIFTFKIIMFGNKGKSK